MMKHLRWLIPFVAALAAIRVWWPELTGIAVVVTVICGLAGLAYLVSARRPPLRAEQAEGERDTRHVWRDDIPPS